MPEIQKPRRNEHERARSIYKLGLEHSRGNAMKLYVAYTAFVKKYGSHPEIEGAVSTKRMCQYANAVGKDPLDYDAWFDYLRLLEGKSEPTVVRSAYEEAVSHTPPLAEKSYWKRYVYLWINYALFEEQGVADVEKARQVFERCLKVIPHENFTFAKIWLMYAQFEVRQRNLSAARKILGSALGKCPKSKLFKGYIALEQQLHEFPRCRILYSKFLEFDSGNSATWIAYAQLETALGEFERARAIYELAIDQPNLNGPETVWKSYIDFEMEQEENDKVRDLFERLLSRTQHAKVCSSYAAFELSEGSGSLRSIDAGRAIFRRANETLRRNSNSGKIDRVTLLKAWKEFERSHGSEASLREVLNMMPEKVKKRRLALNGKSREEYFDYVFPEDEENCNFKLLTTAKAWKMSQITV